MKRVEQYVTPELVDGIYEAAVLPDRWPLILHSVAKKVGAFGGMFMARSAQGTQAVVSRGMEHHLADYIAEGWADDPTRTAELLAEQHPGFRVETDYRSVEEIAAMPIHAQFLDPRGIPAAAATAIQGTSDQSLFLSFEGFPDHDAARQALPVLDVLRPHLARAISLTALHTQRTQLIVDSLALVGAAAAVVGADGGLRASNAGFAARLGQLMFDGPLGLRFADPFLHRQFSLALARHRAERGLVQSVPVRDPAGGAPFAVHLLPIKGAARELCEADGVLLLVADGSNIAVPEADVLRVLFDLTPAEARLTRLVAEGHSVAEASAMVNIRDATARVHLRSIFAKTGVTRQSELARLLAGLGSPPCG